MSLSENQRIASNWYRFPYTTCVYQPPNASPASLITSWIWPCLVLIPPNPELYCLKNPVFFGCSQYAFEGCGLCILSYNNKDHQEVHQKDGEIRHPNSQQKSLSILMWSLQVMFIKTCSGTIPDFCGKPSKYVYVIVYVYIYIYTMYPKYLL